MKLEITETRRISPEFDAVRNEVSRSVHFDGLN